MNTLHSFAAAAALIAATLTSCSPKDAPVYRFQIEVVAVNDDGELIPIQNATVRATAPVVRWSSAGPAARSARPAAATAGGDVA